MTTKHTLPSGKTFELSATSQVTERQRRPVRLAFARVSAEAQALLSHAARTKDPSGLHSLSAADQAVLLEVNDLVAAALIVKPPWLAADETLTPDSLLDLPAPDYDAIVELVGPLVGPFIEGVDFDPTPDPNSPTPPSSD